MDSPGPGPKLGPPGNGQPAKVLQLLWRDVVGGAERIAAQLAEEWSATGIRSELAYLDPPGERWDRRSRILRMRRLLRSTDCQVVLSHTALPSLYARLTAPRGLRVVPVLHSGHDDFAIGGSGRPSGCWPGVPRSRSRSASGSGRNMRTGSVT